MGYWHEQPTELGQDMREIEVDGIVYVPKSSVQYQQPQGDLKIIVLQRGWVMVGRLDRIGSECKLHNASVIRNWGTTRGLGEIAQNGPTSSTRLDKTGGLVEFDYLTVVCAISCEEIRWLNHL